MEIILRMFCLINFRKLANFELTREQHRLSMLNAFHERQKLDGRFWSPTTEASSQQLGGPSGHVNDDLSGKIYDSNQESPHEIFAEV